MGTSYLYNVTNQLKDFLDQKVLQYNTVDFINDDPINIPHKFSIRQDIEISAFFAALFSWGNRTIILKKCNDLLSRMDYAPYDFILHNTENDLKKLIGFIHRTFNTTDLLYFVHFLQYHYKNNASLESAFTKGMSKNDITTEYGLNYFFQYFFSLEDAPARTQKHIASPMKKSSCKRLNMYLRWMVRKDKNGVDFGLWNNISPSQLVCPIDVHVARVASRFNLLSRKQIDWLTAIELTEYLRTLDPLDPVKYDFALFGLGVVEKY